MKLRYFVIDGQGRLRKAAQAAVRALWDGGLGATALGCAAGNELRLVSVVCDDDLLPCKATYCVCRPLAGRSPSRAG